MQLNETGTSMTFALPKHQKKPSISTISFLEKKCEKVMDAYNKMMDKTKYNPETKETKTFREVYREKLTVAEICLYIDRC